ncbi:MAG: MoxR family ATPase [Deltaproteobacteria bacterium]|nr:MoxR family ATPase [Deltaproteobacteria bacterium]
MDGQRFAEIIDGIRREVAKVLVGQEEIVEGVLVALIARGHVLLEGVPGLGKTLLVRTLARALSLDFKRIQFTPDLMPSDVTGNKVYDAKVSELVFRPGPVFTQLLLADEINRAPAKTQSALLEAMQEAQVTIDGESHVLSAPFITMATQNPVESQGTYPLPEAQLDRFMFKLNMSYPAKSEENRILENYVAGFRADDLDAAGVDAVCDAATIAELQSMVAEVEVDERVVDYITSVVGQTRSWGSLFMGASPRASVTLLVASRVAAAMVGRDYINPDDVRRLAPWTLRHRVILNPDAEIEGITADDVVRDILTSVEVPDLR